MYKTLNLMDTLPLPYNLIDAGAFKLNYVGLKQGQSDESLRYGVEGDFSIEFHDTGINISEICDLTVGEVYSFYKELEVMMKDIKGSAVLNDFVDINMVFTAKKTGIIEVNGEYRPTHNFSLVTEIKLRFEIEPNVLDNSLKRFKALFDSLAEIQGFNEFNI